MRKYLYYILAASLLANGLFWYRSDEQVKLYEELRTTHEQLKQQKTKVNKQTRIEKRPDGTVIKTIDDKTQIDSTETGRNDLMQKKLEEKTRLLPKWSIGGFAGFDLTAPNEIVYGGYVQRQLFGPFSVSLIVNTDWFIGLGIALSF